MRLWFQHSSSGRSTPGNRSRKGQDTNVTGDESGESLTLTKAPLNVPLRVSTIESGRQAKTRLAALGIIPGEELKLLRRDTGGPLLLDIKGTRLALGQGISDKINVRRREDD